MGKFSGKSGRIKIGSGKAITAAVVGAGVVDVTCVAHGLSAGMFVLISGVVGMTDLNNSGKGLLVESVGDVDTFTVNLTTAQVYTSDGTAQRILPLTKWDLTRTSPIGDVSDSESGDWAEKQFSGFKEWEATYEALASDGQDDAVFDNELAVELDLDENNYYSGSALFDSEKVSVDRKSAGGIPVSGTMKGNGALTKTRNAA